MTMTEHEPVALDNPTDVAIEYSLLPEEAEAFVERLPAFVSVAQVSDAAAASMLAHCIKRTRVVLEGYSFEVDWRGGLLRG